MPYFNIVNKIKPSNSFRVKSIIGKFDLNEKNYQEVIKGEINIPKEWQIGVIVGNSGTGKTTIINSLFKEYISNYFNYKEKCIIDDMPKNKSSDDIAMTFNSVGFSSPISWLKPYNVLSNGEKMRVDLARSILSENDLIVFDEYTSVVDRNIAKIGSRAVQKAVRKTKKQFIAVGCHFDIIDWLKPDWVFDTNKMELSTHRGSLQRIKIDIVREKGNWKYFNKYHYLNHEINNAGHEYCGYYNGNLCCFISVLHFPHPLANNIKKVHRLVVLPDYQGIGIGTKFLEEIGKMYLKEKYRFTIVTSQPALCNYFKRSNKWILKSKGRKKSHKGDLKNTEFKKENSSKNRITASWEMITNNVKKTYKTVK